MVNMTCPTIPDKPTDPKSFFQNGEIDFKAHDVGWIVCGFMTLVATISSIWLIWKHLTYYTCPQQQRHIVRLLVMVPVYSIVSFLSYLFYKEALYYQTIRDCYEAVLVTSFFYLILAYTGDTRAEQHAVFRNIELEDRFWVWPLGSWKYKPEGLHFLWLMKICVLQYAIIRPLCTFIAVGTEYFGYYCLHSWMPWFTHVWCAFFISVSVTVAMYCLIQLYMPIRKLVDPYKPILKFLAVKTIVFLTFWQDTMLSFLVSFNVIKETEYFTAEQIQAGINALLSCFEMLIIGFVHIKAFSYLPYQPEDPSRTTRRGRALLDSLDYRDWFFEMKESSRYMAARSKGREYTLAEGLRAKRHQHLLKALGKERTANLETEIDMEKAALPTFWKNKDHARGGGQSRTNTDSALGSSKLAFSHSVDTYTSLPRPSGRSDIRSVSNLQMNASGDSHAERTAELQRLVAELDLQVVDQSIVGAEDHDYGYDDSRYERAGLMHQHKDLRSTKNLESPSKDDYPESIQYHTATIQLANVPSLTYDHETPTIAKREHEYSVVAVDEEVAHARQPSTTVPGVGAGGIASWLGWSNAVSGDGHPQQQSATVKSTIGAGDYLSPGNAYGADAVPRSLDVDDAGTGWWRNYWDRMSYLGSREPSALGHGDDDEKEPFDAAPPAVMREVRAGSWGTQTPPREQPAAPSDPSRSQTALPVLKLQTDAPRIAHSGGGSVDSTNSFSPHDKSPLTRFIQTSRDSFSSLTRDEVRESLLASSTSQPLPTSSVLVPRREGSQPVGDGTAPLSVRKDRGVSGSNPARRSVEAPIRPPRTPRTSSLAASARRASTGNTASSRPVTIEAPPPLPSSSAQILSNIASTAKHPIVFADALVAQPVAEPNDLSAVEAAPAKVLPPAVGPKGKMFNLVLPSPLSPARFPYGKEGDVPQPIPAASSAPTKSVDSANARNSAPSNDARPQHRGQPSQSADAGDGSLRWANQSKPTKHPAEASSGSTTAKVPSGKNIITVGGMSLVQAKAAQAAQEKAEAETQAQARSNDTQQQREQQQRLDGPAPKSILREGKLDIPAPSKLASVAMPGDGPYVAAGRHTVDQPTVRSPPMPERRRVIGPPASAITTQTRSTMSTSFEVGNIVPREAVVRASLPANVPLSDYYGSVRRGFAPPPPQMGAGSVRGVPVQRHSFAPMTSGPRPAMLPPHPSQGYVPMPQRGSQTYDVPPQGRRSQQQQYRPPPPPQFSAQLEQQRAQAHSQPQYAQPPPRGYPAPAPSGYPHPQPPHSQYPRDTRAAPYPQQQYPQQQYPQRPQHLQGPQPGQRPSQFQFEYYRD